MKTLTTTAELAEFCKRASTFDYVTVDTEFLRERTYYSKLCLIQLASPCEGDDCAVLVDTLSVKLDLAPLYKLFNDGSTVKVFHAARQDLEIFFLDAGVFPAPFFDTQIAAMVCGFGEQAGYETLVRRIAKQSLDKTSRFTDWSQRPLSDRQNQYAIADVTHLRDIYEFLAKKIEDTGRAAWVEEELAVLTDPATYNVAPKDAWKRIKSRTNSGKFLAVVRALAEYRETLAQSRDIPRSRVIKDDVILELASTRPASISDLSKSRLLLREARKGTIAEGILKAVKKGVDCAPENYPTPLETRDKNNGSEALSDLLRVLLKAKADKAGVAQKLIATAGDLQDIVAGADDIPALSGWRREVFGADAIRLRDGKIGLSATGKTVKIVKL